MRTATLLLLFVWPGLSPAEPVLDSLAACIDTVYAHRDEHPAPSAFELCSGLKEQLDASPYAQWLPYEWWNKDLRREQLVELQRLLTGQASGMPFVKAPDTQRIGSVLQGLQQETKAAAEKRSLWQRFTEWLWQRMHAQEERKTPSWLQKWLSKFNLSGESGSLLSYVLFTLIAALAILAVLNELRAAGMLRKWSRKRAQPGLATATAPPLPGEVDIDAAELRLQPSLLLERLLALLAREQPAAGNASLTHRELRRAVQLQGEERQTDFSGLAGCAERTRFASALPPPAELTSAVAAGRRLLSAMAAQ